jgi:hypothetical protein
MKKAALLMLAALGWGQSAAGAPSSNEPLLLPLDRFIAGFNRWDEELPSGAFTEDCTVLDIFPPFEWKGVRAPYRWWGDLAGRDRRTHERRAALREQIERGPPDAVTIVGARASFNVPATISYLRNGALHHVRGRWIINEKLTASGWRISAHAWATLTTD